MLHAFNNPIRVEELDTGLVMLVGPDHAGNLLEIGVVVSDDGPVIVHACKPTQVPKVMPMPRTVAEILDQADDLAARFEAHEPDADAIVDATALRTVRRAFQAGADAERQLADAVSVARAKDTLGLRSVPWSEPRVRPRVSGTGVRSSADTPRRGVAREHRAHSAPHSTTTPRPADDSTYARKCDLARFCGRAGCAICRHVLSVAAHSRRVADRWQ
jgi:hypothetical protein